MTDEERAEQLARAIDDLIRDVESPDTSHGLNDDELEALLDVARDRLEAGQAYRDHADAHESEVWERLTDRLVFQTPSSPDIDIPPESNDALRDIIALRMQMSREVLDIAESHRDEVWGRLQSRMGMMDPGAPAPGAGEIPIEAQSDDEIEAITRRSLARLAEIASDPAHNRFRERLKRDVHAAAYSPLATVEPARRVDMRLMVGAALVVALTAAIVAPLPITGVDGHPAFQFAESVATHIGIGGANGASAAPP
jgi:hypothetical protein